MEWYKNVRVDDVVVPNNQCMQKSFLLQEKSKQCGFKKMDGVDSLNYSYGFGNSAADEGDFHCEQLEMEYLIGEGDEAEFSGVPGGISESSNCWSTFLNNQDYQLDGFPWTNQTDENFLSSLLVDDSRAGDQFPIYDSPNSQGGYSTAKDLPNDVLLQLNDTGSYEQMDSPKFPYTFGWEMEQSDASQNNLQNMMISSAPLIESTPQLVNASSIVNEDPLVEETVLEEFGSAVQMMTNKSRLCFRDAMYRLATNSEKHSRVLHGEHISSGKSFKNALPDQTLRFSETGAMEPKTNSFDRTIAELLFNRPYQHGNCYQALGLGAGSHKKCPPKQPNVIPGR